MHFTSAQLYQTYRPIGRGGSVATTSEPDPRRVPDIGAARGGLATNSTPDLQLALAGFRAEGARHGFGGRHEPPSIPEDVQVGQGSSYEGREVEARACIPVR